MALSDRRAGLLGSSASSVVASVTDGAQVSVGTGGSEGSLRVAAHTRSGIADALEVAGVGGKRADHRLAGKAETKGAGVLLEALGSVGVGAGGSVRRRSIAAETSLAVASSGLEAASGGRALDVLSRLAASALAGISKGASISVVTEGVVGQGGGGT